MQRIAYQASRSVSPRDAMQCLVQVECPAILALPTTHETVETALRRDRRDIFLVADPAVIPSAIGPTAYLALCKQREEQDACAPSAYVFTDQFVDPPIASILVEHGGVREFLPATEVLARANYGVAVHIWTNAGCIAAPSATTQDARPVLRLLCDYYDACVGLGDSWLMQNRQRRRRIDARLDNAVHRLRLYESAIMHVFASSELRDDAHALLRELGVRRAELTAQREKAR